MISAVTKAVSETVAAPVAAIRVIIREVPTTHFAAGDVTIAERQPGDHHHCLTMTGGQAPSRTPRPDPPYSITSVSVQEGRSVMGETPFFGHIIDGKEIESADGARFETVNPWSREPWAEVALGGKVEADLAITAARRAFDEGPWPRMGYGGRQELLHRLGDLMEAHTDELASADSRDMGKPLAQCRHDVARAARTSGSSPTTPSSPSATRCRWTAATTRTPGSSRPASSPRSPPGTSADAGDLEDRAGHRLGQHRDHQGRPRTPRPR